jgi:hypothetical protein
VITPSLPTFSIASAKLQCTGVLTRIHHALYAEVRVLEGRAATPTLAIVDSQTVKSAEKGGKD